MAIFLGTIYFWWNPSHNLQLLVLFMNIVRSIQRITKLKCRLVLGTPSPVVVRYFTCLLENMLIMGIFSTICWAINFFKVSNYLDNRQYVILCKKSLGLRTLSPKLVVEIHSFFCKNQLFFGWGLVVLIFELDFD